MRIGRFAERPIWAWLMRCDRRQSFCQAATIALQSVSRNSLLAVREGYVVRLAKQLGDGFAFDQLARLVEVVVDDGLRMNADRVIHRGE